PHQKWEVINLGVGDFGTTQEWIALNEFGLSYNPDIVILQIFPLNDICNNSIELFELCGSDNDRYRPYFVRSNGRLQLTQVQSFRDWLRRNVKTYGLLERAFYEEKYRIAEKNMEELRKERILKAGFKVHPELYTYAQPDKQIVPITNGWNITESIIEKMKRLTKQRHIKLIAMIVPFEFCIGDSNWNAFRADEASGLELINDYPEKRLVVFLNRMNIPSVVLLDVFEKHADEVLPYVDGHLNRAGHRIAADELYKAMLSE
ncbi:MAG TPA: hypothetical protein VLH08_05995, partial [Acidobacteriota bacterium]|nr:hypothetical protein [Acidobacteriota bacterium]